MLSRKRQHFFIREVLKQKRRLSRKRQPVEVKVIRSYFSVFTVSFNASKGITFKY